MDEISTNKGRWALVRQAIVFQFKLGLDALRDILMSPVSILLVIVDIVTANPREKSYFLRLMVIGKQSDHWINLFGSSLEKKDDGEEREGAGENNADYWFCKIEELIKERRGDGTFSQSGKEKLQQYFNKASQSLNNSSNENSDKN